MEFKDEYRSDDETGSGWRIGFRDPVFYKDAVEGLTPECSSLISFLCCPETPSQLDEIIGRYRAISEEDAGLPIYLAPMEPRLRHKLVWPLRYAKANFMLGNYLGTIALCGMVAEMVALLLFDMAEMTHDGKPMDESIQRMLFGREFERLEQTRRVDVLAGYGAIDATIAEHFTTVRKIRNSHLHALEYEESQVVAEARKAYRSTLVLVHRIIGPDDPQYAVKLRPELIRFLERNGVPAALTAPLEIQRELYPPR